MHSLKTKLLCTFIGVIALSIAFLAANPAAYAASVHTAASLHSGGGCNTQSIAGYSIGACIGASNGLSDGYINNGACATKVVIFNTDLTNSTSYTSRSVTGTCITGHVTGTTRSGMISGHQYKTFVDAYFGTTTYYTSISPALTW
jgi:hypothetical protein